MAENTVCWYNDFVFGAFQLNAEYIANSVSFDWILLAFLSGQLYRKPNVMHLEYWNYVFITKYSVQLL